jgi:hypothetical protein
MFTRCKTAFGLLLPLVLTGCTSTGGLNTVTAGNPDGLRRGDALAVRYGLLTVQQLPQVAADARAAVNALEKKRRLDSAVNRAAFVTGLAYASGGLMLLSATAESPQHRDPFMTHLWIQEAGTTAMTPQAIARMKMPEYYRHARAFVEQSGVPIDDGVALLTRTRHTTFDEDSFHIRVKVGAYRQCLEAGKPVCDSPHFDADSEHFVADARGERTVVWTDTFRFSINEPTARYVTGHVGGLVLWFPFVAARPCDSGFFVKDGMKIPVEALAEGLGCPP